MTQKDPEVAIEANNMETNKHPLVVFSGGMDSSYMLLLALNKGDVHTCYVKASQSEHKIPRELKARKKLIATFEKMTGNRVLTDSIVDIGKTHVEITHHNNRQFTRNGPVPDVAWPQAHQWIHGIMAVVDYNLHTEVQVGNVSGDDILCRLGDIKADWVARSAYTKRHFVPLNFPLEVTSKIFILEHFPKEAISDIWICELPVPKWEGDLIVDRMVCNECPACETAAQTVWLWERRYGKNYREVVERYLADKAAHDNATTPEPTQSTYEIIPAIIQ